MTDADPPAPEDLPAPYVNPWGLLRRDLLAVLASLRLELWQLWRRNRQGDLPRPSFWPRPLAGWFWPALLALLLVLLAASGRWALAVRSRSPQAQPSPRPAAEAPSRAMPEAGTGIPAAPPEAGPGIPAAPSLPPIPEAAPGESAAEEPPAAAPPHRTAAPEALPPETPPPDPLLQAFAPDGPSGLLRAAWVRHPDGVLELQLEPAAWWQLPPAERQRLAEQWLRRAQGLGHERLGLLDQQGASLGRSARVGSGMILLAPSTAVHDP